MSDVPEGTEFFRHARVYIFLVVWLIGEDCFRRCFPPSDELLQKCLLRSSSGEYFGQRLIELFRSTPAAFGFGCLQKIPGAKSCKRFSTKRGAHFDKWRISIFQLGDDLPMGHGPDDVIRAQFWAAPQIECSASADGEYVWHRMVFRFRF